MNIYYFSNEMASSLTAFASAGARSLPLLRDVRRAQMTALYLEPGGLLGRHAAAAEQLLLVLDGDGAVTGAEDQSQSVAPGTAVFWRKGEAHETRAGEHGLVAIAVEGDGLDPLATLGRTTGRL